MPYYDVFVAAVPTARKDEYKAFVHSSMTVFQQLGATDQIELWGDDVPPGEVTSLPMAVKAGADETVVASLTVWPDKTTRDAAWTKLMEDPAIGEAMGEMPFDGKRMIFGGFQPLAQMREPLSA